MTRPITTLLDSYRRAAMDRWYASQDHVGQADTDPEPYLIQAADAAVRRLLNALDVVTTDRAVQTIIDMKDALDASET